jgi:hypothetical protein
MTVIMSYFVRSVVMYNRHVTINLEICHSASNSVHNLLHPYVISGFVQNNVEHSAWLHIRRFRFRISARSWLSYLTGFKLIFISNLYSLRL